MPIPIDHIIERLGGAEAAARLTGVGTEAVRKWRQTERDSVPPLAGGDRGHRPEHGRFANSIRAASAPMSDATDVRARRGDRGPGAGRWLGVLGPRLRRAIPPAARPVGEVCFSTGMTGYQETLTDPSFAGQIITFTFPHIGNVGTNIEDIEAPTIAARGLVVKQDITEPSNWRSTQTLDAWLRAQGVTGIAGVDTRALTVRIRDGGAPTGVLAFPADGRFDLAALRAQAAAWPGLEGMDLAKEVTCRQSYGWDETTWAWPAGIGRQTAPRHHVVAVDYGAKRNILRCLASAGCRVTVVPATATAEDILRHKPDGVFLSNGPGRSGGDRGVCGAGDPRRAGRRRAGVRDLPRPPVAGAGAGGEDLQDGARPSRGEPAGAGPGDRARWRSPARTMGSRWMRSRCRRA